jgi:hypothetical protein
VCVIPYHNSHKRTWQMSKTALTHHAYLGGTSKTHCSSPNTSTSQAPLCLSESFFFTACCSRARHSVHKMMVLTYYYLIRQKILSYTTHTIRVTEMPLPVSDQSQCMHQHVISPRWLNGYNLSLSLSVSSPPFLSHAVQTTIFSVLPNNLLQCASHGLLHQQTFA